METSLTTAAHLVMLLRGAGFMPMLPPIDPNRISREVKLPVPSTLLHDIKLLREI